MYDQGLQWGWGEPGHASCEKILASCLLKDQLTKDGKSFLQTNTGVQCLLNKLSVNFLFFLVLESSSHDDVT